jgi:N-acetylglucosaminyl-diphospho-decaprenol L-rhamnosyltransferase
MFFEKEKFIKYGGFDENFFLYYEDTDLQKRFIEREQKIINIKVYFKHLYGSHNKKFNFEIEINRNWHYMWSRFFFMKKNYNYLFAFIFTFPTFVRSLIKVILYYFINKKKYFIYKGRFLGLINSYLGKKSWHRAL